VLRLLGDRNLVCEFAHFSIDANPNESLFRKFSQLLAVLTLSPPNHGSEDLKLGPLSQRDYAIGHLLNGLARNRISASVAEGLSDARVEESKVVVDLGRRSDRGPGALADGALFDRDGGRKPVDRIDVGLWHLLEKLARIGGQRFDVPALAFGVDRVECQ
jgi:hypothetical protein